MARKTKTQIIEELQNRISEQYETLKNQIKIIEELDSYCERLETENEELKELVLKLKNKQKPVHNARGAGRKRKTSEEKRNEIRHLYANKLFTMDQLAKDFKLGKGTIFNIIKEKN